MSTSNESIRVLHIDDEQNVLHSTKIVLEDIDSSLHIESFVSEMEALKALTEQRFDCVITDYLMPNINGIEIAKKIRETSLIPIIIYTGQGSEEVAEEAFKMGVDDYFRKETDLSHLTVLAQRIHQLVQRHQAEEEVKSLARFPSENSNPVLRISKYNEILYANLASKSLLTDWKSMIGGTVPDNWALWVSKALDSNVVTVREVIHRDRNLLFEFVPINETDYVNVYGKDITDIVEAERRFENLLTLAPVSIMTYSITGHITSLNQATSELTGYSEDELLGKHLTQLPFFSLETVKLAVDLLSKMLRGQDINPISFNYTSKTGKRKSARAYARFVSSPSGMREILAVIEDTTESTRLMQSLRESEELFRGFMQSATDVFILLDENLCYLKVNDIWVQRTGLKREEVIGKSMLDVFPNRKDEGRYEAYLKVLKTGEPVEFRAVESFTLLGRLLDIKAFKTGDYLGIISRDVSDTVKYQRRLEALHRHAILMSSAESIDKIASVTVNALKTIFGYQWIDFNIVLGNKLVPLLIIDEKLQNNMELSLDGKGVIVRAYNTGKSQIVSNAKLDKDYVHGRGDEENRWFSELAVPVKINENVVAVLNVEDVKQDAFSEDDAGLVEILAEHVSSAMLRIEQSEVLVKSEEKYRTFLESSMDAVFVVDEEKYLYVNQKAVRLLGYMSSEELIGTDAFIHVAPDDREKIKKRAKARQEGAVLPSLYEMKLIDREGNEIDVEVNVTTTEYMGRFVSLAINRDISQRKRLEDVLQEVQSLSQWGYFERNIQTGKRFWSNGMYRLCGIDPRVVDPDIDYAADRIHPDDRDYTLQVIEEAQISRKSFEVDFRFLRDDGEIRIIRSHGQFTYDEQGTPILRRGSWQDITKYRKAEDRLSLLHKISLSLLLTSSIDEIAYQTLSIINEVLGFCYTSFQILEDSVLVTVNYFDNDNPIGGNSSSFMRMPIEGKGVTAKVAREAKTILLDNVEESFEFIKGTTNSKSELAVPILFEQEVLGVLNIESLEFNAFTLDDAILMEILAQHVAYAIMKIQIVKERELFNQLLLEEQIKAEQAREMDQIKSNFINTATHELRTPVTSIIGYLELLFLDPNLNIPENIRHDINVVHRNALRLVNLINDLLDVQRITAGQFEIQKEPVDLIGIIDMVVEEMSPLFNNKKQTLTLEAPKTLLLNVDEKRIIQLLTNILRNATKFTPDEGRVTIRVEPTKSHVVIKVKDTGVGLNEDDILKLFKPFPGIRHEFGVSSTGLGLAICKGIVDVHHGSISACSDGPGKGSVFTVTLPA